MKSTLAEIDNRYGIQWRFDTARCSVAFWAEPEDMAPEDSFEFADHIAFARQDEPAHWFCAVVGVFRIDGNDRDSECIGYDCLGGCSYNSFREFLGERTGWRKGTKLITHGYFPDMVRQALSEARTHAGCSCGDTTMKYSGTVENVGTIVSDTSKGEAIRRVRECIKHSARAGNHGFVQDENGEIVWERGQPTA